MRRFFMIGLIAASACSGADQQTATSECPPGVTILDAWTKPARAGQPVSAAYVTICNGGDEDDALIAVGNGPTPVAGALEIHESSMTDGVMSMKQIARAPLPAGQKVTFKPGGGHIMLFNVETEIADGAAPTFRLDFENAEDIYWAFEVREPDDSAHDHH